MSLICKTDEVELDGIKIHKNDTIYFLEQFSNDIKEFKVNELEIKDDRCFAYNKIDKFDLSRKIFFFNKENVEIYKILVDKFNNIDHNLLSEKEFFDLHVRFKEYEYLLDTDDKNGVISQLEDYQNIIVEMDMVQKDEQEELEM